MSEAEIEELTLRLTGEERAVLYYTVGHTLLNMDGGSRAALVLGKVYGQMTDQQVPSLSE